MVNNSTNTTLGEEGHLKTPSFSEVRLAIVIPAYKGTFLKDALASLSVQSNRNFKVYVGDDCSPDDIAGVCGYFSNSMDILYHRFPENLGQTSLVDQWVRCVELSKESWVWLFADDDTMEESCVESFYRVLEDTQAGYDIYRFNTLTIDKYGDVCKINRPHPEDESSLDFAYHRLRGNRDSYASEYVFSREVYNECGGLVNYPLAWCSDDATWIRFAAKRGLRTIAGPHVLWRRSGLNITTLKGETVPEKLMAAAMFLDDLSAKFSDWPPVKSKVTKQLFDEACRDWFYGQFQSVAPVPWGLWLNWPAVPKLLSEERKTAIFARMIYIHLFHLLQAVTLSIKKIVDRR